MKKPEKTGPSKRIGIELNRCFNIIALFFHLKKSGHMSKRHSKICTSHSSCGESDPCVTHGQLSSTCCSGSQSACTLAHQVRVPYIFPSCINQKARWLSATNLLRGRFCYCSAAETSQPHPTTAMRVSSTLILRASSGFSLGMASRISHYPLHSRRTPLLCHHRQQFSLWSLASIVKNKGAPRYPSLAVNFD